MAKKKTDTEEVVEVVAEEVVEIISPDNTTVNTNLSLADLGVKSQSAGKQVTRRVETTVNGREIIVESYK